MTKGNLLINAREKKNKNKKELEERSSKILEEELVNPQYSLREISRKSCLLPSTHT